MEDLRIIATDYEKYCDFFGGRNLESQEDFEADADIESRINYLQSVIEETRN